MEKKYITVSLKKIIILYTIALPFFQEGLIIFHLSNFINKFILLFALLSFFLFQWCYMSRNRYYWLLCNAFLLILTGSAIRVSGMSVLFNLDFYGYFSLLVILMLYNDRDLLLELKDTVVSCRKILLAASFVFFAVVILYARSGNGYDAEGYLRGPFSLPHTLAYYCLVIYALAFIVMKREKAVVFQWLWCAVKGLAILFCLVTAVRSAVLAMAILVGFDYLLMRSFSKKSLLFIGGILALLYVVLFTDILTNIPVIQKTIEAAASGSISNGRERFASYALEYYNGASEYQKAFGSSIDKIRDVMYEYTNIRIHAHNDFINILVGYGYVNFAVFLILFVRFGRKTAGIFGTLLLAVLLYFNGLYMYAGFTQCIPVLAVCFSYQKLEQTEQKGGL